MWTAPVPQEFSGSDRIACIHMSHLLMRLLTAGQDGFQRHEFQTRQRPLQANGSHGLSRTSDRSILPSASFCSSGSTGATNPPTGRSLKRRVRMRQASALHRNFRPSSSASRRCGHSCWRAPRPQALTACAPAAPATTATDGRIDQFRLQLLRQDSEASRIRDEDQIRLGREIGKLDLQTVHDVSEAAGNGTEAIDALE
jgi:hypothetical protein